MAGTTSPPARKCRTAKARCGAITMSASWRSYCCERRAMRFTRPSLTLLPHDKRLAVLAREQLVRLPILDEPLALRVHLQARAQNGACPGQIHRIGRKMLRHPPERFSYVLVAADRLTHLFGRSLLSEAIGNV